jgi:hypothetical protein
MEELLVFPKREITSRKLLTLNRGAIIAIVLFAIALWGLAISLWFQVSLNNGS